MTDAQRIIKAWKRCDVCNTSAIAPEEGTKAYLECEYTTGLYCRKDKLIYDTIKLITEQEKEIETLKRIIEEKRL